MLLIGIASDQGAFVPPDVFVTLTGVEGTGELGTLIVQGDGSIVLGSVEGTGEVGTLSVSADAFVTLTGVEGSGEVGTLVASEGIDGNASLTGVEATGELGTLTVAGTSSFVQIGNTFTDAGFISGSSLQAVALDANTIVVCINSATASLRALSWDGTNWSQVGNTFNISGLGSAGAMARLTSTTFAFLSLSFNDLRTYSFDGTNFAQVGSALATATSGGGIASLTALSSTRVAGGNAAQDLRAWDWNGSTWTIRTGTFALGDTFGVTALDSSNVAISINTSPTRTLRKLSYSGSAWSLSGSILNHTLTGNPTMATLTSTLIALRTNTNTYAYSFNGSTWSQYSSAYTASNSIICGLDSTDIAHISYATGEVRRLRLI